MGDNFGPAGQNKTSKINQLLTLNDKGASLIKGPRGVLSLLLRKIFGDIRIEPAHWAQYMIEYLNDPRNKVPQNNRDRTSERGNLNREFTNDRMSWMVFLKALRFLQATDIEFGVKIRWRSGKVTSHAIDVSFRKRQEEKAKE